MFPGLTAIKLAEEARSTKRTCTVHALQANLQLEDCSRGVSQCETIDDGVSATDLCPKTQTAVKCIHDLHCVSDVILRLTQLQKLKLLAGKTCDINSSFPLEKSTSACDVGVKGCLYPYVTNIVSTNVSSTLCSELNKFVGCKRAISDTCKYTSSQLTTMGDNEKTRMRLGTTCSLNKGSFMSGMSATLLITTLLTTITMFIKI
ncbi:uncharacterized protein LOC131941140 [Physella acuta]|uniref:uncharacterized protein LOC131941140 n=1 Tax=Physella acuta TaxID=109671 RepID=UPI0027DE375D|nr:uncharacterized protein LOC131941140 [Physella acuta]